MYSLLLPTTAASYNHLDLLKALVQEFHVDANITDEDGETPLFVVESVEAAQCLLEELKADPTIKNVEGLIAEEKIRAEGENVTIADFLAESSIRKSSVSNGAPQDAQANGHLPPLPPNVKMNLGSLEDEQSLGDIAEADPDFKRRIEELAASDNFQGAEGQKQLRELIADAIKGGVNENRDVRQRLD